MILFDSFFCFQVQKRIHISSMRGQSRSFSWLLAWMDAIFPPPTLSSFRSRLPLFLCRLVVLLTLFPWHSSGKPRQAAKQNKGRSSLCLPHNRDRKIAITSALPYVNNIPHPSNTSTKTKARGATQGDLPGRNIHRKSRTPPGPCTKQDSVDQLYWERILADSFVGGGEGGWVPFVWVQGYQGGPEWCQWEADNWMIRKPPGFLT